MSEKESNGQRNAQGRGGKLITAAILIVFVVAVFAATIAKRL